MTVSLFAPPERIETKVFAEAPAKLRKGKAPPERLAAGKGATPAGCFLEGPAFDRESNLYVVDLAFGRIFRITPRGEFHVAAEYDGEPTGIAIHQDSRLFAAAQRLAILARRPNAGRLDPA